MKHAAGANPISRDIEVLGKRIKSGEVIDLYEDDTCSSTFSVKVLGFYAENGQNWMVFAEDFQEEYIPSLDLHGTVEFEQNVRVLALAALACPCSHTLFKSSLDEYIHLFTRAMIVPQT